MALHRLHPEIDEEETSFAARLRYPRPISAPPTPSASRATSPSSSRVASDDEDDDSVHSDVERDILSLSDAQNDR